MDPGDPDEPSREELESRVAELEQTVSKMLPDRRGVLKGLGAAAVGGAAVGASSGGASGQSAAGQVGTESEPVDVEAANVAAESVSTGELNNAAWPESYGAIGDGATDDQSSIQDCLDNEQFVVFRPNTTYYVGGPVSVLTDQTTLLLPTSTTIQSDLDAITANRILEVGNSSTSVSNVRIVGGGTLDGQSSAPSGGTTIIEDEGGALNLHNVSDAEVTVNIKNAREYAIEVAHSSQVRVHDSDVNGAGNDGFSCSDGGHTKYGSQGDSVSEDVTFRDCYATNCNDSGFETDDGPTDVTFAGCHSESNGDGFIIHSHLNEVSPSDCSIRSCVAENNDADGIGIESLNGTDGRGYQIVGGRVSNNGDNGISLQDNDATVSDITISGVSVIGSENYGIFIFSNGSGDIAGIDISGVTAHDNGRNGIGLWSDAGQLSNGEVTSCRCYNNGQQTSLDLTNERRAGIALVNNGSDPTDISVTGNRCYDDQSTQTQGFGIYHGGDYNVFVANIVRGNASAAFGGAVGLNSIKANNIS